MERYNHKISVKRPAFLCLPKRFHRFYERSERRGETAYSWQCWKASVWSWPVNFLHRTKPGSSSEELFSLPLWYQPASESREKRALSSCSAEPAPLPSCFHSPRSLLDKPKLTSFTPADKSGRPRVGEARQVEAGQRVRQSIWCPERRAFLHLLQLNQHIQKMMSCQISLKCEAQN